MYLFLGLVGFRKDAHSLAYDAEHDLVSAAPDGCEPEVPVEPADQHLVSEAHPSPELEAGVCNLPHKSPALQLAHGGQLGHVPGRGELGKPSQ